MKIIYIVIGGIVLAALMAAGGFFGGMTYAQSQAQNTLNDFARQRGVSDATAANTNTNDACGFGADAFPSGNQGGGQSGGHGDQFNGQGSGQFNDQNGGHVGGQFGGQFGGQGGFAQLGNCVARGQIKSVNGDTMEISTANKVVTIKVSDQTVITKTERGALSDLKPGDRVTVFSSESGNAPTASGIQLQRAVGQGQ